MMARVSTLAVAVICLAVSAGAGAQSTTIDSYFTVWSTDRAQINLRKQAACAVRKYPADARKVIIDDLNMRTIVTLMPHLMKPCGEAALFKDNLFSISQPVFDFVLAEALIARLPAGTPLTPAVTAPPLPREALPQQDLSTLPSKLRDGFEFNATLWRLDVAGECAVRRDPEGAATLVRSTPYSAEERASLQRMDASLRSCDASPGAAPDFIRRGLIAYELYRLLDAAGMKDRHA